MLQAGSYLMDFAGDGPIQTFDLRTCLQVHNSVAEEVERFFAYLLGVMPSLQHPVLIQLIPYLVELPHQFMVIFGYFNIVIPLR